MKRNERKIIQKSKIYVERKFEMQLKRMHTSKSSFPQGKIQFPVVISFLLIFHSFFVYFSCLRHSIQFYSFSFIPTNFFNLNIRKPIPSSSQSTAHATRPIPFVSLRAQISHQSDSDDGKQSFKVKSPSAQRLRY